MGNPSFQMPRRFLDMPMSAYFECGSSMTGAVADQSRISVYIVTDILPKAGKATVATTMRGVASPVNGASNTALHCSSSGRFEERMLKDITPALAVDG